MSQQPSPSRYQQEVIELEAEKVRITNQLLALPDKVAAEAQYNNLRSVWDARLKEIQSRYAVSTSNNQQTSFDNREALAIQQKEINDFEAVKASEIARLEYLYTTQNDVSAGATFASKQIVWARIADKMKERHVRYNDLQKLVYYNIVNRITTNEGVKQFCIGPVAMEYWLKCFTTPTVSTNSYETVETFGDSVLKMCVIDRMYTENPRIDSEQLTGAVIYYANNVLLGKILEGVQIENVLNKTSFQDFLLFDRELLNVNFVMNAIIADLFEAILGTIQVVTGIYFEGSKIGYGFAFNWFTYLFEKAEVKMNITVGNNFTVLGQIFDRFKNVIGGGLKLSSETAPFNVAVGGNVIKSVIGWRYYFDTDTLAKLKKLQNSIVDSVSVLNTIQQFPDNKLNLVRKDYTWPESVIGMSPINLYVIGDDIDIAKENAAKEALEVLRGYGITPEWASKAKQLLELSDNRNHDARGFRLNLIRYGFVDYNMKKLTKYSTEGFSIMQLIGKRANGEEQLIKSIAGYQGIKELVDILYEDFATRGMPEEEVY